MNRSPKCKNLFINFILRYSQKVLKLANRNQGIEVAAVIRPQNTPSSPITHCSSDNDDINSLEIGSTIEVANHRYKITKLLGTGAFGCVYLAEDLSSTKGKVAVKINRSPEDISTILNEETVYKDLASVSNLVKLNSSGPILGTRMYALILEYVDGQALDSIFEANSGYLGSHTPDGKISLKFIARVAKMALLCIADLRKAKYLHLDFKPDNVLIAKSDSRSTDKNFKLKVIDVGSTKKLSEIKDSTDSGRYLATRPYRAPEIILAKEGRDLDLADLFSLGCTLYKCVIGENLFKTNKFPFRTDKEHNIRHLRCLASILGPPNKRSYRRLLPDNLSAEFKSILFAKEKAGRTKIISEKLLKYLAEGKIEGTQKEVKRLADLIFKLVNWERSTPEKFLKHKFFKILDS